jgi:hypothetical protein
MKTMMKHGRPWWGTLLVLVGISVAQASEHRKVLLLDGSWEMAEGSMAQVPVRFDRMAPVPGLADMAQPQFVGVGESNQLREAFWYRKRFHLDDAVPAVAILKVHKAAYGTRVYLNGKLIGEHQPSFTPGYFNVREHLRGRGGYNDLVIRVGASRDALSPLIPSGWDFEKSRYLPGLFDSVELILSGTPHLTRVQVAPEIAHQTAHAQAVVRNDGRSESVRLEFKVREAKSRRVVGSAKSNRYKLAPGEERAVDVWIPIKDCRLWSPEDPFLYELEVDSGADRVRTRFGMREFRLDPSSGRAYLNGRPYYLRGSNVTLYRFFEDAARGDRPWREEWVRRLHREFKGMNWNSLRYCIGFPPELWYRIADEEGLLIQDEFPIWQLSKWPVDLDYSELAREYTEWMEERWNHPCVVIWDAQNETVTEETGKAIQAVRWLDLSRRPWDNGWGPAQDAGDAYESHPYLASDPGFRLSDIGRQSGIPGGNPTPNTQTNAIILNEYGWLWLNRDGSPTPLTREVYRNMLGTNSTVEQRRYLYARYVAAKTEFWRSHRACAGVLHFCGLGYSRTDGQTSDPFLDIEKLTWEPFFHRYVRDAFAPVGVMLDEWAEDLPGGLNHHVFVSVINDLEEPWKGSIRFRLFRDQVILYEQTVDAEVAGLGHQRLSFNFSVPADAGHYYLEAALVKPGSRIVTSLREFNVLTAQQRTALHGLAIGRPVKASSQHAEKSVVFEAPFAVDGRRDTRWSSDFADPLPGAVQVPEWIAVDLEQVREVSRVVLVWANAYAKAYAIQVSSDGEQWREVYHTDQGNGRTEAVRFDAVQARWIRVWCTERATPYGYALWEFQVFER